MSDIELIPESRLIPALREIVVPIAELPTCRQVADRRKNDAWPVVVKNGRYYVARKDLVLVAKEFGLALKQTPTTKSKSEPRRARTGATA